MSALDLCGGLRDKNGERGCSRPGRGDRHEGSAEPFQRIDAPDDGLRLAGIAAG